MDANMNKAWKKPKVEEDESDMNGGGGCSLEEQEEALVALIEHRLKEVQHLRLRATYYQSQVAEAEKKLNDSQSKLARLRSASNMARPVSNGSLSDVAQPVTDGSVNVKSERRSASPLHVADEGHSRSQAQTKPRLLIPAVRPKVSAQLVEPKTEQSDGLRPSNPIENVNRPSLPSHSSHVAQLKKRDTSGRPMSDPQAIKVQDKDRKRKLGRKEHKDLISSIRTHSSPRLVLFHPSMHISSHHKRKLRTLALNPINDELFVTSALDGIVNLWQLQSKGSGASVLSTTDCVSPKQRRWPEDLTWHPDGDRLFAAYSADGGDSQISILNFNSSREKRVTFLEEKPHAKGIINNIVFMQWDDPCFTTGGSDHAVILWHEKEDEGSWKPKTIHRNLHSSAVMGVAGLQHKQMIVSVGADKRIVGFDVLAGRAEYKHQIESKCMSVLPNPCDFNLFMVQTAVPERQLRLFDIRLRQTEIHAFGWKQESSESQSSLINQAWSPDGFYITSGSADPTIHIFDIRYDSRKPSQSVQAHQKRVFKAVWHHSLHLLVSISSDLNIGLHRIT